MNLVCCTIRAISHVIADENVGSAFLCEERERVVSEFILGQVEHMPGYLRKPFHLLALLFALAPILSYGHSFHRSAPQCQRLVLARWRASRLGFRRDFVRFFDTLVLFALADQEITAP